MWGFIRTAAGTGMPGRVTPHSPRRTYTTVQADAGVPLKVIDYVTGHESAGLILGTYTHLPAAIMHVPLA